MTGPADDPRPINHVLPAWDLVTGAYGAMALLAAERDRRASGKGREIRLALSDIAAATLGNLGQIAETGFVGDRARNGNELFGAFGRDFVSADGKRLMIVALTPRQWTGLVEALDIGLAIGALESRLSLSFVKDEGARFDHRDALTPIVEEAVGARHSDALATIFDKLGVCWSAYDTLAGAMKSEPRFVTDNPIFAMVKHPGGATYPTPGAAVRIPGEERHASAPAPALGQDSDEVLSSLLDLSDGEIARLRDQGLVG